MADPQEVALTGNLDIDALLTGYRWDTDDLTFSFPDSGWWYVLDEVTQLLSVEDVVSALVAWVTDPEGALIDFLKDALLTEFADSAIVAIVALNGFDEFNAAQQDAARHALEDVSSFTNLSFTEVDEGSFFFDIFPPDFGFTHGTLRYAETDSTEAPAFGIPPLERVKTLLGGGVLGDTWYKSDGTFDNAINGNYAAFTILHESGHALGLKHAHEEGLFGGRIPGWLEDAVTGISGPVIPPDHNSLEFTVMTYVSRVGGGVGYTNEANSYPTTYMMLDIQALQYMYGANFNYNSGDTVYSWDPATGEFFIDGVGQGAPAGNKVFMTIWDGNGNDTYDLSNYSSDATINLNPGEWTTTSHAQLAILDQSAGILARGTVANALLFEGDTRSLIENAIGGSGNDTIVGNDLANNLAGNAGNDNIAGGLGDDTLNGGDGNDSLDGGSGNDVFDGGAGDDVILAGDGDDSIQGGVGNDNVNGGAGSDSIQGGDGNDTISGETNADTIDGGGGADQIFGGAGTDSIDGGFDGDEIHGGDDDDTIRGGAGGDLLLGENGSDIVMAGADDDTVAGGDGQDTLFGEDGNDTVAGDAGDDLIYGGLGLDILSGGDGNDHVFGDDGADSLFGDEGNDTLEGGNGPDTLNGGNGFDIASYAVATGPVVINLQDPSLSTGDAKGDVLISIEQFGLSAFDDTFIGLDDPLQGDVAFGDGGNDTLLGYAGNDILHGEDGDDFIAGGAGADEIDGGAGFDTASYSESKIGIVLDLVDPTRSTGNAQGDSITGIEQFILSEQNDEFVGTDAVETIRAGHGNDLVYGNGGGDTVFGGEQHDQLYGGSGDDTLFGESGDDALYGGDGSDLLDGGDGRDQLFGGAGADILHGGTGDDLIAGDGGNDTMWGDAGRDDFIFAANGWGSTTIMDFQDGLDRIDIALNTPKGIHGMDQLVISDRSGDAVIQLAAGGPDEIVLHGIHAQQLNHQDFLFL